MTELESIVRGCQKGDSKSQKLLYEKYSGLYYALCRRYTNSVEEAQDLLIEGFVQIFQKIVLFRDEGALEAWMRRIFINLTIDHYRYSKYRQTSPIEDELHLGYNVDMASQIDVPEAIRQSMTHLSHDERVVFNLVTVDDYTLDEAASLLKIAVGTVKSRFYRARKIMQDQLERRLGKQYFITHNS